MNSNLTFNYSVSTTQWDRNKDEKSTKFLKFSEKQGTINDLITDIKNHHSFCACFNHEGETFGFLSTKTQANLKSTQFIVYDFDAVRLTAREFYSQMQATEIPPSLVYTSLNNGKYKFHKDGKKDEYDNRYRVIYLLNSPIYNATLYKQLNQALKSEICITIDDNNIYNDKSDSGDAAHMYGGNRDAEVYSGESVLSLEWLCDRYGISLNGNKKPQGGYIISKVNDSSSNTNNHCNLNDINVHSNYIEYLLKKKLENEKPQGGDIIKKREEHYITMWRFLEQIESNEFINDYINLSINEIIEKYICVYPSYEFTQIEFDVTQPFYMVPEDYMEIKRKWHYREIEKENGDTYRVTEIERCKNGQGRRRRLFLNLMIRRLIEPSLTFDHLLFNALYELNRFIDNSDKEDVITKKDIAEITVNAYFEDLEKWRKLKNYHKPKFKVNKEYCVTHNLNARRMALQINADQNKQARQERDAEIAKYYNPQLKEKENLNVLEENGVVISLRALQRWKKENGYTKRKKSKKDKQPTVTANGSQRATESANNTLMEQQPTATANGSQRATESDNNTLMEQQPTATANEAQSANNEVMSIADAQSIINELHPYYSEGAKIEKIGKNKYLVTLGNKVFQHDLLKVYEKWLDANKIKLTKLHLVNGIGDGCWWQKFEMGVIA